MEVGTWSGLGLSVTEEAALRALGVHVSPVGQDEGQVGHTSLQQPPQVLSHKLIPLLRQMQPIRQVDGVVLQRIGRLQRLILGLSKNTKLNAV